MKINKELHPIQLTNVTTQAAVAEMDRPGAARWIITL